MKPSDIILCPQCGASIAVSETLVQQMTEQAKKQLSEEMLLEKKALAEREKGLLAKEQALVASQSDMEKKVAEMVKGRTDILQSQALQKAKSDVALEMKDLKALAEEKDKKLRDAETAELHLRKEKRDLEEKQRNVELEMERRLSLERKGIHDAAVQESMEQHKLREAEKDKTIQDMRLLVEDLKRKGEQGSQQAQGEVMELELEEFLRTSFPFDGIDPVPKGFRGADVLQRVQNRFGQQCGTVIWESKRTKAWSDGWIQKLKDDQREAKADIAIIVTDVLPKEIPSFGFRDGVWITNYRSLPGFATITRIKLEEIAAVKQAAVGKNEKVEVLYAYLSGPEFRQKMEAVLEMGVAMQQDLEREKRLAEKSWAKREKHIQRVVRNTAGIYGDMQGLIGTAMQPIAALEPGEEAEEEEAEEEQEKEEEGGGLV